MFPVDIVLGLFLFITALQKIPNAIEQTLRNFSSIERFELNNIFVSYSLGFFSSMIFQSSSVTIILLMIYMTYARVSFHNAFAIMLGATCGVSASFLIPSPGSKLLVCMILLISHVLIFLGNSEKRKTLGKSLSWIGFTFLGWVLFVGGLEKLAFENKHNINNLISSFSGPFEFFSLGTILTALAQSADTIVTYFNSTLSESNSSQTDLGVLVLGANIGTATTAIFVALWLPVAPKRIATAHLLIKIFGVTLCLFFYDFLLSFTNKYISQVLPTNNSLLHINLLFNTVSSLTFLPVSSYIESLMEKIIPDGRTSEYKKHITLSNNLINLLSNVPNEGLDEVTKRFKGMCFSIKSYEDRLINSMRTKGIRGKIEGESLIILHEIQAIEKLLLKIRSKHKSYTHQAGDALINFYRLKNILIQLDKLNLTLQNLTREQLNHNNSIISAFLAEWQGHRSQAWQNIFNNTCNPGFKFKSQQMSNNFLRRGEFTKEHNPWVMESCYEICISLVNVAQTWEMLISHQSRYDDQLMDNQEQKTPKSHKKRLAKGGSLEL